MRPARAGLPLLGLPLLTLCSLAAATAGRAEPSVRVLLLETDAPVRVRGGSAGARGAWLAAAGAGLRADARAVGPVFRAEAGRTRGSWLEVGGLRVRGRLEVRRVRGGLRVVNVLPLEDYVAGTVGREVYPDWEPEMLKAQAVVARTYALHRGARARDGFDVEGGTSGQVYGGLDAETPSVQAAARATRGEVLCYRGAPILAAYHSASGGRTASAEEVWGRPVPYLVSLPVRDEEDSPDTYWRASVDRSTLGRALAGLGVRVGPIRSAEVVKRSGSGRALRVAFRGTRGSRRVDVRALRQALGADVMRSTLFEVKRAGDGFAFVGSGHGHGVGMSQWGGQAMARAGASYREILATFYPGTELEEAERRR